MSDAQTAARGQRAALCNEFIRPILDSMREDYMSKMIHIAQNELNAQRRCEAITKLSVAMKIHDNIASGLDAAIEAGKVAEKSLIKSDEIERMGVHRRRLLDIVPLR